MRKKKKRVSCVLEAKRIKYFKEEREQRKYREALQITYLKSVSFCGKLLTSYQEEQDKKIPNGAWLNFEKHIHLFLNYRGCIKTFTAIIWAKDPL